MHPIHGHCLSECGAIEAPGAHWDTIRTFSDRKKYGRKT